MKETRKRVLLVGCGDVARRLLPRIASCFDTFGLLRQMTHAPAWRALGMKPVSGDLDVRTSLQRLAGLADVVIHLAPPPGLGCRDTRTRNLVATLAQGRILPKRLVYISTTGVYGNANGARVAETWPRHAATPRAIRRVDAEDTLRSFAARTGARLTILRAPGIYAGDRLPLDRLRAGTAAILEAEDSHTNHIHADDLARAIAHVLLAVGGNGRAYNIADDSALKMGDYFDAVADHFALPRPPRLPRHEAERAVPEAMRSFMRESRRIDNARMKRELGFVLQYPTVAQTLRGLSGDGPIGIA